MLLPTHLVIDKTGVVSYHVWGSGKNVGDELSAAIERLLAKKTLK